MRIRDPGSCQPWIWDPNRKNRIRGKPPGSATLGFENDHYDESGFIEVRWMHVIYLLLCLQKVFSSSRISLQTSEVNIQLLKRYCSFMNSFLLFAGPSGCPIHPPNLNPSPDPQLFFSFIYRVYSQTYTGIEILLCSSRFISVGVSWAVWKLSISTPGIWKAFLKSLLSQLLFCIILETILARSFILFPTKSLKPVAYL